MRNRDQFVFRINIKCNIFFLLFHSILNFVIFIIILKKNHYYVFKSFISNYTWSNTKIFRKGEVNVHSDCSNGNDYLPTCHSNELYLNF